MTYIYTVVQIVHVALHSREGVVTVHCGGDMRYNYYHNPLKHSVGFEESEEKYSKLLEEKCSAEKKWAESEEKLANLRTEVSKTGSECFWCECL